MRKRIKTAITFRAVEWAQGPETSWPLPYGKRGRFAWADATDKYLALAGSLLRAVKAAKTVRCPRPLQTDKAYDKARAMGYFEAMTGQSAIGALYAEACVHGEKRPRIRYVTFKGGKWEIPHWNWNGHNETPEDCRLIELFKEAA